MPDPVSRLAEMARAYRQFALTHREEYGLMFSRPIPEFQPGEALLVTAAMPAFAPLQRAVAAALTRAFFARWTRESRRRPRGQ